MKPKSSFIGTQGIIELDPEAPVHTVDSLVILPGHFELNDAVRLNNPVDDPLVVFITASLNEGRSEEHTSELQSRGHLVCRLLLGKKKRTRQHITQHRSQEDMETGIVSQ